MLIIPNLNSEGHREGGCTSLLCLVHGTGCEFTFGCLKGSLKIGSNVPFFYWGGGGVGNGVVMGVAV